MDILTYSPNPFQVDAISQRVGGLEVLQGAGLWRHLAKPSQAKETRNQIIFLRALLQGSFPRALKKRDFPAS